MGPTGGEIGTDTPVGHTQKDDACEDSDSEGDADTRDSGSVGYNYFMILVRIYTCNFLGKPPAIIIMEGKLSKKRKRRAKSNEFLNIMG
jgi:hypothetical protein